jgi:vacuolar-type H+-ATPase subunit C/Vma6
MILIEAHKLFHDVLGISLNSFLDGMMMALMKKPIIDIGRFDDWLHEKFGEYEDAGMSMSDVLENNYGKLVSLQISDLLGLDINNETKEVII